MSKRQQKLQARIGGFMRQYQRKASAAFPNDRWYDRQMEGKLKRLRPEELDALLNDIQEDEPPSTSHPST